MQMPSIWLQTSRHPMLRLFATATALVALADLASKHLAVRYAPPFHLPTPHANDLLRLAVAFNPAGPLNLLGTGAVSAAAFVLLCLLVLAYLFRLVRGTRDGDGVRLLALALVAGGTLGNLLSRLLEPRGVIDFISLNIGGNRSAIFNAADVFIGLGAALLLALAWRRDTESPWWKRGVRELW